METVSSWPSGASKENVIQGHCGKIPELGVWWFEGYSEGNMSPSEGLSP